MRNFLAIIATQKKRMKLMIVFATFDKIKDAR
jgi:hypothetical protein